MDKFSNLFVAKLLREIAAAYEIKGDKSPPVNRPGFRAAAYSRAADSVEHLSSEVKDLWDDGKLDSIPGVGRGIAKYLDEYFRKGRVTHFEAVKKGLPKGMFILLDVPGVGAKTAYKLAKILGVGGIRELEKACREGRVGGLEGFGEQSEKDILRGIAELKGRSRRMALPTAFLVAEDFLKMLRAHPNVKRADSLGSLRRTVSTIGDVDLAAATNKPREVIQTFVAHPRVKRVLAAGEKKASVVLGGGRQVDLVTQSPNAYGALLQYFTGSKAHNIHLRKVANEIGLSLSEHGIAPLTGLRRKYKSKELIQFSSEEQFYKKLKLPWIPPELREDTGEIEAAKEGTLPHLVELNDIKGDLHVHCNFPMEESHDPGLSSMEEIVKKATELKYKYIGICNHSPSVSHHNQQQIQRLIETKRIKIEQLSYSYPQIRILNVLEIDILANKTLALSNEHLSSLDLVLVGIHSSMKQSKEEMTKRVLSALENPHVHILTHPTGRLLLKREGYELDWAQIFKTCRGKNKILEINAYPDRLDLPDTLVREAVKEGVRLIVNTDAHQTAQMDLMKYGVAVARRGWAEKENIVNTLSWSEFKKVLKLKME